MTALLLAAAIVVGPVPARVVSVLDGDTIAVEAQPWLGISIAVDVRVRGVDAPESGWRAKCPEEAALAAKAKAWTRERAAAGSVVILTGIGEDKYGGRVVASVAAGGEDVAAGLIAAGLAREYDGGTKTSWCGR